MLVGKDKLASLILGQTTYSRCGMECLNEFSHPVGIRQGEMEIAAQMCQMGSAHRARTMFGEINRVCGYLGYSKVSGDTKMNDAKMAEVHDRKSM